MFKNSGITPGNDSTGKVYAVHNICQQPFFTTVHPCLYSQFFVRVLSIAAFVHRSIESKTVAFLPRTGVGGTEYIHRHGVSYLK